MHRTTRITRIARITPSLLAALALLSLPGCDDDATAPAAEPGIKLLGEQSLAMPIFTFKGSAVSPAQAESLAAKLGLENNALAKDGELLDEHGAIRYMDGERFLQLPTKQVPVDAPEDEENNDVAKLAPAPDLEALGELEVLPDEQAIALSHELLALADLNVPGAKPVASHATFELRDVNDEPVLSRAIDTTVHHDQTLGGVPLRGSGAKIKLVFDGQGQVTQLTYARPLLEEQGVMEIVPPAQATALCAEHMNAEALPGEVTLTAELAYHVPADAKLGDLVLPQYSCGGTQKLDGELIELRRSMVPAVLDQPKAEIIMTPGPGVLLAEAEVSGGLAPYTLEWVREGGDRALARDEAGARALELEVTSREPVDAVRESLRLIVTDARGVRTEVAAEAVVPAPRWSPPVTPRVGGVRDAGVEWIGSCGGLGGSQDNAGGFVSGMQGDGVNVRFNWGNSAAWEQDFKDDDYGGDDDAYADNADIVFFTGHAGGNGFSFCSEHDDALLRYDDARWGDDNDLEWLVIAACGPLQQSTSAGSWANRWGPAFDRLHLLMAYASTSYDNRREGSTLASYLTRQSPLDVRRAWVQTATDIQSSDVTYAVMGVALSGWAMPNYTEYFWGHGSTGADVPASQVYGYWRVSGAS